MSDTHGYLDDRILAYVKEADQVWHAGDIGGFHVTDTLSQIKPLAAVYGNIDDAKMRKECPLDAKFKCEEVKVWMTHIEDIPIAMTKEFVRLSKETLPISLFLVILIS
jgi:putative phosphoesterase